MNTKSKVDDLALEFLRHKRQTELILKRYDEILAKQKELYNRLSRLEGSIVDELAEVLEEFSLNEINARVLRLETIEAGE